MELDIFAEESGEGLDWFKKIWDESLIKVSDGQQASQVMHQMEIQPLLDGLDFAWAHLDPFWGKNSVEA